MNNRDKLKQIIFVLEKEYNSWNSPVERLRQIRGVDPFFVLLSTIVSLRTKDEITIESSKKLFRILPNPNHINKITIKDIENAIYPAGFYKRKAIQIKEITQKILTQYNSKVPNNIDTLLSFNGVGLKTASLVLSESYNQEYICVDTHVHRISNRIGIVQTHNPLQTQKELHKIIDKKHYKKINYIFVGFGQSICKPLSPICSICKINYLCQKNEVDRFK
ncbi:MAG: endonuclease III domain-containing protein [Nanoarchaeota archaeon]